MTQKLVKSKSRTKSRNSSSRGLSALVGEVEKTAAQKKRNNFSVGDAVKVHVKIREGEKERIQVYEGVVIKKSNGPVSGGSFIVRKISYGVGVERIFLNSSPRVMKVETVTPGLVRRAKLYYLRDLSGKASKIERDMAAIKEGVAAEPAAN